MDIDDVRELFVGVHDKTFLDSACVGLAPTTAQTAIAKFLDMVVRCDAKDVSEHHIALDQMRSEAITEAAKLFNAVVDNVLLIESTTHGLNIAANSIPFEPDDEVIICDLEYLQVAIPFVKKHQAHQLKLVKLMARSDGSILVEDFAQLINKNTKAICLSAVQWCTGQRTFTKELGALCQSHGIWLIVDGVQEAGALDIDVNSRYCDFYIAGGHKWLNAPYGCGIMYLSERALKLEPPSYGYLNLPDPENGWGSYFQDPTQSPFRDYSFPQRAKSFSIGGTSNYPGAIGLCQSLKLINELGPSRVQSRVLELASLLKGELNKLNVTVLSSSLTSEASGITMFRLFADPEQDRRVLDHLLGQRIFVSIRYTNGHGGLRASTHYFNNEEDIGRLCHVIKEIYR